MAATRKLDQSKLMLEAGQSGEAAVQRAQESRTRNVQQTRNRAEQSRQFNEQTNQRELDRWQRQWEEKRANDLRQQQLSEQSRQFDVSAGERAREFDVSTNLTAADKGLTPTGAAPAQVGGGGQQRIGQQPEMGTQGGQDPRMASMQAEMRRGSTQMGHGLEIDTQGRGFVKSAQRQKQEAGAERRAESDTESRRISAVASYRRAVDAYKIAELRMDAAQSASARSAESAALKELKGQLMQPIKSTTATMNRMQNGKGTLQDWQSVAAEVANTPDAGSLNELKADIAANTWTDRLQSFMQQKVTVQALKYINATGELPDGELVDLSSPGMQMFTRSAADVAIMNSPQVAGPGQLLSFRDQAARIRYIHRLAAWQVLNQKPLSTSGVGGAGPQGMPNPAAPGAEPAPGPSHEERAGPGGVPPGVAGGPPGQVGVAEAARRAPEPAPATGKKPYKKPGRSNEGYGGVPLLGGDPGQL